MTVAWPLPPTPAARRCHPIHSCAYEDRSNEFPTLEHSPDSLDALLNRLLIGADRKVGIRGRFVWIGDASELADLSSERFLVEALHIAHREHLDGAVDKHLEE